MEGRFRQREQTNRGKVQAKGADRRREGSGKGSKLMEGRVSRREKTGGGKLKAKGAD